MKSSLIASLVLTAISSAALAQPGALRILLVNDDGCHSPGITTLQTKLAAQGFDVWLVAPSNNQSAIGSAITFKPGKIFDVEKVADKHYCFPGTPADSVDFGLLGVMRDNPPDLVISGVNDGPNTGASQLNSGTVSAAVRALRYGYPAIAASIGYRMTPDEMRAGWPSTKKYWPESVDYVVEMVKVLDKRHQKGEALMPAANGISINYPARAKEQIKGVKYVENEAHPKPQIGYKMLPDGKAQQLLDDSVLQQASGLTDSGWLEKGWITYTLFDGRWDATQQQHEFQQILNRPQLLHP